MLPFASTGRWEEVNPRAQKVERRREQRHQRHDQSATSRLTRDKRIDVRFSFSVSQDDNPLAFLFDEVKELTLNALNSRKKIDRQRRRLARELLHQAYDLKVIRHQQHGATIIIASRKHGDFWIPIREADCQLIDDWHWATRYAKWQQRLMIDLLENYDQMSQGLLRRLFRLGGVTYHSPRIGAILLQLEGKSFTATLLEEKAPVRKVVAPMIAINDELEPEMLRTWEQIGANLVA